ncbi:GNAT family N-acetyltransferase [Aliivibrio fischeri]|uniref:GNAT family N-acetyltransferase n=1 Tax=Aliivibrio fischeri TaxID=668 RepID=UPI0012D909D0|nr:GNAT family N-acetyltransferase [Aliivibrio fischeri]MUJ22509.1 GNAT family N-acetyltransferase [Aliivibrio fischeri]MUK71434.1 GNAT family N-acetyltransferase [Aliivibrio fischeri]MUK75237.1 GNAT family N-acetyltransferase [Aliivibrio fischeri]
MLTIKKAQLSDIQAISNLYEMYLSFYQVDISNKDPEAFLRTRLENNESVIFYVVNENNEYVGFAQLYPLFCSLEMNKTWLLYDLYVHAEHRKNGVAQLLLDQADLLAKETNASFVMLSTGIDNLKAQKLYEKNNYIRDNEFYTYVKSL